MAAFSNLKIAIRMALGTGLILVLLAVVAGAAFFGLSGGVESFAEYRLLARQTAGIAIIESDALTARLAFRAFMLNQTDENAGSLFESVNEAEEHSEAALALFESEDDRQQIGHVTELLAQYEAAFTEVMQLQGQRNPLVDRVNEVGPGIEKNLTSIMESANRDGDAAAAYGAGDVLRSLMLGRLYGQKFLMDNGQESLDRTLVELADAEGGLSELLLQVQSPQRRDQATQAAESVKEYIEVFGQIAALISQRNELISGTMDKVGPEVATILATMADESKARQDELGPQASAAMERAMWVALTIAAIALAVGALVAFLLSIGITRPVVGMTRAMGTLAAGDTSVEIVGRGRKDEIGEMAEAVQVFKENAIEVARLQEEQKAAEQRALEEKKRMMNQLADSFQASVGGIVETVSSSATEMQSTAQSLTATAEETSRQSTAVAAASEQASTNVQTVASAAEELSSSIAEISRQVAQSAQIAGKAVSDAESTNVQVQGLAEAAQKIGQVVQLINDIASQTNLLALNATIEAARAGEAGKGFAVVAAEVKNLANETAKATDEITGQITSIQGATREAVTAIQSIGQTIGQINEIATTIASAVEEQGAATQEIARNVQQAAAGTQEVSSNISGVTQAAGETGAAASQMLAGSGELARQGEHLRAEVDKFLQAVRAA